MKSIAIRESGTKARLQYQCHIVYCFFFSSCIEIEANFIDRTTLLSVKLPDQYINASLQLYYGFQRQSRI